MTCVGLVLGAGGVTGEAFHRGVLGALRDETGWDATDADVIVGTSAGSLVAAGLRVPPGAKRQDFHPPKTERADVMPDAGPILAALRRRRLPRALTALSSLLPAGRRSTLWVVEGLRRRHGGRWPERPLWIVAVRRHNGERVVFGRDGAPDTDVATAAAASCAIPGYFHPVMVAGEAYLDGGVHSPTNADLLVGQRFDLVVVSSPMSLQLTGLRPGLDLPARLACHRQLSKELRPLRRAGTPVLCVEPDAATVAAMGLNPLRAHRIDEVEARAYELTQRRLRSGGAHAAALLCAATSAPHRARAGGNSA